MLQNLFLAVASTFALSAGMAGASEYLDGLRMGGIVVSCQHYMNGDFKDPGFAAHMIEQQYDAMSPNEQRRIIKLWNKDGDDKCIHATHGHAH
jgi:hypothetical protein